MVVTFPSNHLFSVWEVLTSGVSVERSEGALTGAILAFGSIMTGHLQLPCCAPEPTATPLLRKPSVQGSLSHGV